MLTSHHHIVALVGAAAGVAAVASYADARLHIRSDLRQGKHKKFVEQMMSMLMERMKTGRLLTYQLLEDRAACDDVFLVFEGREWTYAEFFRAIQPVANWLLKDLGVKKGDMVALDGTNSPEWLLVYFALEAVGAVPALINNNLTAQSLKHCIKLAEASLVLADDGLRHLVGPVEAELAADGVRTVYYSPEVLGALPPDHAPIPEERREDLSPFEPACIIYTSGTTGMPKGTVIVRARELAMTIAHPSTSRRMNFERGVRMYTPLPLFHGAAHGLCLVPTIAAGSTVVLSRKFSHRTFWPEVHASGATHIQYVGELCRYLVNAPPGPLDRGHRVRAAWGNGMRPDVWEPFRQRFGIETVHELYAATDGLGFTSNPNRGDFSRGAIGVRGALWHWLNGENERRILIDTDTQEVLRGPDGLAIVARTGEAGEMVTRIDPDNPDAGVPSYYKNPGAVAKRRLPDVLKKGDLWYRSGDLMRLDSDGRLFFVDRLGDTFRWKSENVSTNEVSDVVGEFPEIAEANVYGVLVPRSDGRAGCAAIVPVEGVSASPKPGTGLPLDFRGLAEHCLARLPRYAVPIFVRVVKELEYTGTMKLRKGPLRAEGIDLDAIEKSAKENGRAADSIYWLPPGTREYVPFGRRDLQDLQGGAVKL